MLTGDVELNLAESEVEVVVHVVQSFVKAFNIGFGDPQEVVSTDFRRSRIRPAKNTCKCCRKIKVRYTFQPGKTSNLSLLCVQSTAKSLILDPFGEVCK